MADHRLDRQTTYGDAANHGLLRAIIHMTIANATSPHRSACEPVSAPKSNAIASVPISDPPWLRFQFRNAQRYVARVG
jgi:hypothetical protein